MSQSNSQIRQTEYGPVKGVKKSSILGRDFFTFATIPFMKAPVGRLRFRDPQPPESWTEPFDSTIERPSYCGFNPMTQQFSGQEDAGILSVHTPYMDRKLPVAVYIHGGGFQFPCGSADLFGFDYLLQKDICFVLINYRVGPIGFLSLSDPELGIPGNAGLKDQVAALKWVQKNIANFGGDPNNVTVFGTSAGGSSVHFLMMSEQARGLFQKAIPMSGTSFIKAWAMAPKKDLTERLATALGWDGKGGERGLLEVLESSDVKDIIAKELTLLTKEENIAEHILFPFTPVVEPYVTSATFLSKDPVLMGRDAWSNDIHCMFGGTSLEGALMGLFRGVKFHEFLQSPETLTLTRELGLDMSNATDKQTAAKYGERLRKFYFGDNLPSADTNNQYYKFAGDLHFWHGIYRALLSRANSSGRGKTFLYRFDVATKLSFAKVFFNLESEGSGHGEDMFYLFRAQMPGLPSPDLESDEFKFIKQMVAIVTSFIINGDPNSFENKFDWPATTTSNIESCLNISNKTIEMIPLPELDGLKVWFEILREANVPLY